MRLFFPGLATDLTISLQIWDPVTGSQISQYDIGKNPGGVSAVQILDNPLSAHYIVAATSESTMRFVDLLFV